LTKHTHHQSSDFQIQEILEPEPRSMKAAFITQTGGTEVIQVGEVPKPSPGPGQVLVKVAAAAINPIDLYLRSGLVAMPIPNPYIIGTDLAGTVVELGSGVSRLKVGDRVWGSNQGLMGRQGGAAEFAAVDEHWLYPTPSQLNDAEAAAQALTGITAHLGLFQNARMKPGEMVYVSGGSGGVGSMVIQMVKAAGGKVATTAGSDDRVALCKEFGADLALNYKTDDVPASLKEWGPDGLDIWFETQREPNLELSIPMLRKRGRMIVMAGRTAKPTLPLGAFYPRDCQLLGFAMFNATPTEQAACAAEMNAWSSGGKLKARVGKSFPLAEAQAAEKFLEDNTLHSAGTLAGKVVISI
jgi:NADPH2:quinone reductase